MLSDEDRAWLKALNAELWSTNERIKLADEWKKIPREDLERALALIEPTPLVTTLYCSGMFGGVGITLFEHELYPGTGPERLLNISEQMVPRLDVRSVYEHLRGVPSRFRERKGGSFRQDCWDLFTSYAFTPRNEEWCKMYNIKLSKDSISYEY